jgi:type IV secretory pathway VirD2 relaxase
MVKVLPKSGNTLKAVRKHLDYIGRQGERDLETDDGALMRGKQVGKDLLDDWDLDLDEHRRKSDLTATRSREPMRLVHKVIFSMPAGTPPEKVLAAVRNFAREEFALKHRYVMALHTDEPHPHVHVVIKAVSELGQRLHIRKATLHDWREGFARHLRDLGVAANATPRYVRGETGLRKSDGIYRASLRGASTHMRERTEAVAQELARGKLLIEPGKTSLVNTRNEVRRAWEAISDSLTREGQPELAAQVRQFVENMQPPLIDREHLAVAILKPTRARALPKTPASR